MDDTTPIIERKGHEVFWNGQKKYLDFQNKLYHIHSRNQNENYNEEEEWNMEKWIGEPAPQENQSLYEDYIRTIESAESSEKMEDSSIQKSKTEPDAQPIDIQKAVLSSPCLLLFDPCTKEPIADMQALEKRIREIKKQNDTIPVGLFGLTNDTSNFDFLTTVFANPAISLDEMVSFRLGPGSQVGSDIYEVLSRLFVLFGGIENVNPGPGGNYKFMKKIEDVASEVYEDTIESLKFMKCKATRAMGISDITLVNVRDASRILKPDDSYCEVPCDTQTTSTIKTYLISVKWYQNEKNAEHYDLEKLYTAAQKITSAEQKPLDIIVFLKSKKDFEIAHNRAYRRYTRDIAKTFFGWNEDVKPFLEEKRRLLFESAREMGITPLQALEQQYFRPYAKPVLSLQLHQDIIVKGLCDRIEVSEDNLYLVGVLPRGGKTFIAGGIIREFLRRTKIPNLNIFWLTAAPNETIGQVSDELLKRFQDFADFEFVWVKNTKEIRKSKPHSVFFCSTQLLLSAKKPDARERTFLFDLLSGKDKLGLVFFDEAHKTGTGDQTKAEIQSILQTYSSLTLPFIFLTATYYNILFDYHVQRDNTFIWDYTDVLMTRALATESEQANAISNLQNRFGEALVNAVLEKRMANNETLQTMAKAYLGFPDLYFVSADFQEETQKRFSEQGAFRPDAGFALSFIFALKPGTAITDIKTADNRIRKDAYKIFENLVNPKNIISLITPHETFDDAEVVGTEGGQPLLKEERAVLEPSLLGRINKMSSDAKSRFRLDERPSMLMFMPTGGPGTNIFYLLCAWASLLMTHKWWRENYEIACVVEEKKVGDVDIQALLASGAQYSEFIHIINDQPKKTLLTLERRLHCEKSKGLIILAGEKLSMGISLPCTDLVFLLNEKKSPDDIIQKMYRALTPSPGKKAAFIVDLNPVRTLAALYGYTRASHTGVNTTSEILDIIYDTYTWDADVFEYNLKKGADAQPLLFQDKLRIMFEMAEKDTSNEYRINEDIGAFEKKLATNVRRGMNSDFIQKLTGEMGARKLENMLGRIGLREGSEFQFSKGRLVIRTPALPPNPNAESEMNPGQPQATIEIQIDNFIETLADFVKYLAITSSANTFHGALEEYETNTINATNSSLQQNVVRMIRGRTDVKEGTDKSLLSKLLVAAVKDFAFSSSEAIFRQMKGKIDDNEIRKDKILSIIHKRLTPRQKQRKEAGEVFTPLSLIEKVMGHLPDDVWNNPSLKWIDPANGIGNFPVYVFYKLDEGLKAWEPNDKKRRKHIIENMLYMVELQSNNNRIARKIFTSLCDGCNPNILTANSVQLTSEKLVAKGFPDKYDIVMGNPPFQLGRNMMFYVYFIDLANKLIKEGGHLVYVIPNKILIPNKANESIRSFNPLFVYHTVNDDFRPTVISTTICGVICKKEPFKNETTVQFSNGEMLVDLNKPTPTQYNDINMKKLSDKILFGSDRQYLRVHKNKPTGQSVYISRVWMRYSPDKPAGGSHIFRISDSPLPGDDGSGRYVEIPESISKELLVWFLSRSKVMRFITKVYAGAMNVPAFLWDILPFIPLTATNDDEVNRLLNITENDKQIIVTSLNDAVEESLPQNMEGGARRRRTIKKRRTLRK